MDEKLSGALEALHTEYAGITAVVATLETVSEEIGRMDLSPAGLADPKQYAAMQDLIRTTGAAMQFFPSGLGAGALHQRALEVQSAVWGVGDRFERRRQQLADEKREEEARRRRAADFAVRERDAEETLRRRRLGLI